MGAPDPAPGPDPTDTDAQALHAPLPHTGVASGKEQSRGLLTDHARGLPELSGVAALEDASTLTTETCPHTK